MKKLRKILIITIFLCGFSVKGQETPPPLPDFTLMKYWTGEDWNNYYVQIPDFMQYMLRLGYDWNDINYGLSHYWTNYQVPEIFIRAQQGLGPKQESPSVPFLPYVPQDGYNDTVWIEYRKALSRFKDYLISRVGYRRLWDIYRAINVYTYSKGDIIPEVFYVAGEIEQREVELPDVPMPDKQSGNNAYTVSIGKDAYDNVSVDRASTSISFDDDGNTDTVSFTADESSTSESTATKEQWDMNGGSDGGSTHRTYRLRTSDQSHGANDYISYGYYMHREPNTNMTSSTAYFWGPNPVTSTEMNNANGMATYKGETVGTYHQKAGINDGGNFEGTVMLKADFENDMISGNVHIKKGRDFDNRRNFVYQRMGGKRIKLEETEITDDGRFAGKTNAGRGPGAIYHGEFHNHDSDSGNPSEIGGLYKAFDSKYYYQGAFGANKDGTQSLRTLPLPDKPIDNNTNDREHPAFAFNTGNSNIDDLIDRSIVYIDDQVNVILLGSKKNKKKNITIALDLSYRDRFNSGRLREVRGTQKQYYQTFRFRETSPHNGNKIDYLTYGLWVEMHKTNVSSTVYFWGPDPISSSEMKNVNGTASYTGETVGAYHDKSDNNTGGTYVGTVNLSVDFNKNTIDGNVNITAGRDFVNRIHSFSNNKTINFDKTLISSDGRFAGETNAGTGSGGIYHGEFHDYDSDSGKPEEVGGLYKASDNYLNYQGAFGASKD